MICRVFIWRDGKVFEFPATIPNEAGLKKGGNLSFEFEHLTKLDWYEYEAAFVIAGDVEIIGLVLGYERIPSTVHNKQRVIIEKISIKENPIMSLAYDKDKDKTTLLDPAETEIDEKNIGISLMEANIGKGIIPLQEGGPLLGKTSPAMSGNATLAGLKFVLDLIVKQNKEQQEAIEQLQNKYDKMNEDVQELIDNYIPDLSNELSDEG